MFQKNIIVYNLYKLFSSCGPKNVPTRTRISDIAIYVGTFCTPSKCALVRLKSYLVEILS